MLVVTGVTWCPPAAGAAPDVFVAQANTATQTAPTATTTQSPPALPGSEAEGEPGVYTYDPSGRRDPFNPLILGKGQGTTNRELPPLQRIGLTEISLIGVIWGGFGYTAMVQTPDGKGYSVRRGTRMGPNNGVVTKVTKQGIVVTERFTDLYGKEQEREHVKLLHSSEE